MHHCESQLNGAPSGAAWDWRGCHQFNDRAHLLKPGKNSLTLWSEYRPAAGDPVPALMAVLEIKFKDGSVQRIVSDSSWKALKTKISSWETRGFDDSAWPAAQVIGQLGDQPWGPFKPFETSLYGPQTTGSASTRVTYVPYHEPIVVSALKPGAAYAASIFDPVTGKTGKKFPVKTDAKGQSRFAPPAGHNHDWVLVIESSS